MLELETRLYRFNLNYLKLLAADFDEAHWHETPIAGGNSPLWILGHLTVATDYALRTLGEKSRCPKEWHRAFGPGSDPLAIPTPYPAKADLLAALETGHLEVISAAQRADPARMAQPHNLEILRGSGIDTLEEMTAHLMTTHEAMHLGQLSLLRRKTGKRYLV